MSNKYNSHSQAPVITISTALSPSPKPSQTYFKLPESLQKAFSAYFDHSHCLIPVASDNQSRQANTGHSMDTQWLRVCPTPHCSENNEVQNFTPPCGANSQTATNTQVAPTCVPNLNHFLTSNTSCVTLSFYSESQKEFSLTQMSKNISDELS